MANLPLDIIIFYIQTCLDAIDVLKCKSVCSVWRDMISTPQFEDAHYSRLCIAKNQRTILIRDFNYSTYPMNLEHNSYGPETINTFPFQNGLEDVEILAHLDGLLCVCLNETREMVLWNPTTTAHTHLSTTAGHGYYSDNACAVGLYKRLANDYNIIHITQTPPTIKASVYSRNSRSWQNIAFQTNPEYAKRTFYISPGTFCGTNLYFTICECWVVGRNVVIAFDTLTKAITELPFPLVSSSGIFQGLLANVQNTIQMVLTTGMQNMSLGIWALQEGQWVSMFSVPPIPPISFSVWLHITHYMTKGNWFVISGTNKLYEITIDNNTFECFYPVSWFRGHRGMVYVESIVSPSF
ncbi:F-box/kelch-repeat protein At3g23880-like [Bidens hawaiensis]|uniref:F-box/kelch-repeat protein At3g23880-like n=1 Tax=Bidens hawaiensis TaxID=980011 RepID=UPI0040495AA8